MWSVFLQPPICSRHNFCTSVTNVFRHYFYYYNVPIQLAQFPRTKKLRSRMRLLQRGRGPIECQRRWPRTPFVELIIERGVVFVSLAYDKAATDLVWTQIYIRLPISDLIFCFAEKSIVIRKSPVYRFIRSLPPPFPSTRLLCTNASAVMQR